MPFEFPDWSDLGLGHLGERTRYSWDYMLMLSEQYRRYYDGDVFEERVQLERPTGEEAPLLFPVGLNLVKIMCQALADAAFGEWDEYPIQWGIRKDKTPQDADQAAIDLAYNILENSNAAAMFWELELDRQLFGGGAFKIQPDLQAPGHIKWMRIPRESFFPIWDPDDPDNLLEAYLVTFMSAEQAKAKYGYEAHNDIVRRIEHWTLGSYENLLDQQVLPTYSGVNPWGIVPVIYTPRTRLSNWYGDALTKDLMTVQDELNMRIADIGDAINYNAHPVRWGLNLPRDFNSENYPLGPNALWNLGRSIGSSPEPKVGLMEAQAAVSPGVFEHVDFIYSWARTSAGAPPIAFGEDDGGGQRSGVTLEIRMWPLLKAIKRSRAYLRGSLMKALKISAAILKQKDFPDVPARAIKSLQEGNVGPVFFPMMPRDQAGLVDEVVKLLGTTPPAISIETAEKILGRGPAEVERIRAMLQDDELFDKPDPAGERKLEAQMAFDAESQEREAQTRKEELKAKPKEKPA